VTSTGAAANSNAEERRLTSGAVSTLNHSPPKGSSFERFTKSQIKRLAKPLAASVSVRCLKSSAFVMCPMMETWAFEAFMGLFLVSVCKAPSSHA
jgi:hypothetical protein